MNIQELIKVKCIEKHLSARKLETMLGFSNGYIKSISFPMANYDRAKAISDALDIPLSLLLKGYEDEQQEEQEVQKEETEQKVDVMAVIEQEHGDGASEAVKMLLELNPVGQAELRGEMRQMLRLKKYNDALNNDEL